MFSGYARLAFVAPDGTEEGHRYSPGDTVELPDQTDQQQADLTRLLNMGVVQRTNPAGNNEELDDLAPPVNSDEPRKTRAQAKLAEKARRAEAE